MLKYFTRPLAAAGLALAVALGGVAVTTTEARADNDNLRNFLGAAAGLVILGAILENRHDNRRHYGNAPATRHVSPGLTRHRLVAPGLPAPGSAARIIFPCVDTARIACIRMRPAARHCPTVP